MKIKGVTKYLFIRKSNMSVITFIGNKIPLIYPEIEKIEYRLALKSSIGYFKIFTTNNKKINIDFDTKDNDQIKSAVEFISVNHPSLEIIEIDNPTEKDLPFYQKNIFIAIMLVFCCFPLGLFLTWYYKKHDIMTRILLTIFCISILGIGLYAAHINYINTVNEINNTYTSIMESIDDESNKIYESIMNDVNYIVPVTQDTSYLSSDSKSIFKVGDVFDSETVKIMFLDAGEYKTDNEFIQPETGNKFIYVEFSIENTGESDYSVGSVAFDCYADNSECKYAITGIEGEMTSITTLSPGRNAKGKMCYEVPINAENIEIEFETSFLTEEKIYFVVK